ncbi:MAG: class I SAM-dependent RNA methyltransferase [Chloroflexota bacterium]
MAVTQSPEYEVDLTTLVYSGETLGRLPDGRAVFVPYALPGERARIRLVEEKRRYVHAQLLEIIEPVAERIEPRCPHFTHCGGCHYQNMGYPHQLVAKTAILTDQLERIGGLREPPVQSAVSSPVSWNYRNHIQFHLCPTGGLGFQAPRSRVVVPVRECHLPEDMLNEVWPLLDIQPLSGLERVGLRLGVEDEVLIVCEGNDPSTIDFHLDLPFSAVYKTPEGVLLLAGDSYTVMKIRERMFRVSAGSFFQVNTGTTEKMVAHLLGNLDLKPDTVLVEAYCGVGLFSAFLAPHVGHLIGIESDPGACDDFVGNLDEFDHVTLYQASTEDVLPHLDLHPDIVLVDPPRIGLGRQNLDAILSLQPDELVYISCDPATLGRDARRLTTGGYLLHQITPFDMFPQTYHIESISFWKKGK